MANWQEPCSSPTEQYAMPAKMWMQPKALKCLCAQIRCGFRQRGARSFRTRQQRTGSNCTIEVSRVDLDEYTYIYTYIYKCKATIQQDYLSCFTAQQWQYVHTYSSKYVDGCVPVDLVWLGNAAPLLGNCNQDTSTRRLLLPLELSPSTQPRRPAKR